jgi:hypothetical protein
MAAPGSTQQAKVVAVDGGLAATRRAKAQVDPMRLDRTNGTA